ncbi:hypothetical protein IWZ00DRAFT_179813 [Phyllosticta capitalensis]|uniref:Uncharacterized protein n=1 Tax=Phyllosticta capitalensis TaxID=121624 RepID=A0ABR1YY51_9PEZI
MSFFHNSPVSVSFSGRSDEPLLVRSPYDLERRRLFWLTRPFSGPGCLPLSLLRTSSPGRPCCSFCSLCFLCSRATGTKPFKNYSETHLELTNTTQDRRHQHHQRHQSLESSVNNLALGARVERLERENKALKAKAKRWDQTKKLVCQSRLARGAEDNARFRASVEGMVERDLQKKEKKREKESACKEKKSVAERFKGLFKSTEKTKET